MDGRILSIQSHVAFGYVGGKAAVFPLQCLGFDVDVVNTVNFSNHTGYGRTSGSKVNAAGLSQLFNGMEENGLLSPSRLLTGYIAGPDALQCVAELAKNIRSNNPDVIFLLDPVLGDSGKLYVSPECVPVYRTLLPLATIITPNWFEVEQLTQIRLQDISSLRKALRILHEELLVPHVVISSIPVKNISIESLPASFHSKSNFQTPSLTNDYDHLLCISSSSSSSVNINNTPETLDGTVRSSNKISTVYARIVPQIPGYFSGVGDLFSALVLAHFPQIHSKKSQDLSAHSQSQLLSLSYWQSKSKSHTHTPLSYAASQALTKTYAILELTHDYAQNLPEEDRTETDEEKDKHDFLRKVRRMKGRELRIVQGQDVIRGLVEVDEKDLEFWPDFWNEV